MQKIIAALKEAGAKYVVVIEEMSRSNPAQIVDELLMLLKAGKRTHTRLIGAILLEQSDKWATQRARYTTLKTIGAVSDDPTISLPAANE